MNAIPILEQTDEQILKTVHQLRVGYGMKRTLRYATKRDMTVHNESNAEHVFGLLYLTQFFLPLEDPQGLLDVNRVSQILLFHDFGEITHGDVPYHLKTKAHEEQEKEDAQEIFASLPPELSTIGWEHWLDYEQQKSSEAKFVYALDKVEPLFELLDPVNEQSMKRLKFTYQMHIGKKTRATENYPVMRRFLDVISKDMLDRGVFWPEE